FSCAEWDELLATRTGTDLARVRVGPAESRVDEPAARRQRLDLPGPAHVQAGRRERDAVQDDAQLGFRLDLRLHGEFLLRLAPDRSFQGREAALFVRQLGTDVPTVPQRLAEPEDVLAGVADLTATTECATPGHVVHGRGS